MPSGPVKTELYYPGEGQDATVARLYERIVEWIGGAKQDVFLLADGFACADRKGVEQAKKYIAAYHKALEAGTRIVRVEIQSALTSGWSEILADTMERYPGSFELHFLRDNTATLAARCFAIDTESPQCRAMVSLCEPATSNQQTLEGFTTLVSGDRKLAGYVRDKIQQLIDSGQTGRLSHPDKLPDLLKIP